MKGQRIFPGIILIGFGLYFFLERAQIHIFTGFYTWPTLFCIVGLAFLLQAYYGKDVHAILPGVILFGFGAHFHLVQLIRFLAQSFWYFHSYYCNWIYSPSTKNEIRHVLRSDIMYSRHFHPIL